MPKYKLNLNGFVEKIEENTDKPAIPNTALAELVRQKIKERKEENIKPTNPIDKLFKK